ncbi:AraC family transcriptional regulator [Microbacterium sp.]|uniref:AraC family transcriptional regulator n=1 Tax=Microbacterium sp. TaxID=51671 RepID=UPI002810CDCC|nr:AraC family transcriptional regulator [Microbacterium sp.]
MIDVSAVLRLIGGDGGRPTAARRHRSILVTSHTFDGRADWMWNAQPEGGDAIAGLAFADAPLRVRRGADVVEIAVGEASFLHPHRAATIETVAPGTGMSVWLPWDSLQEVENGVQTPGHVMSPTPLTAGLKAFLTSLLTQQETPTLYTDYLVERVVVEMAFGVLLESVPKNVSGARDSRSIDRARSLMLLRRSDPDFGVAELAGELHISTRHVQRLFAAENSSPADELRGMRIELANELLGDPAYDPLTVAELALHAGFKTPAALRRAFASRDLSLPDRARRNRVSTS